VRLEKKEGRKGATRILVNPDLWALQVNFKGAARQQWRRA
jgi:hypothetical protein